MEDQTFAPEDHQTFALSLVGEDGKITKSCSFVVNEKLSPHVYIAAFKDLAWQQRTELLYGSAESVTA